MKTITAAAFALIAAPLAIQAQDAAPVGRFHLSFDVGLTQPEPSPQLEDPHGRLALGVAVGRRHSARIGWEVDYLSYGQSFDRVSGLGTLPPLTFTDGRASGSVSSLSGTLRAIAPLGAFEPFAGAGFGYYRAKLSVTGLQLGLFPVEVERGDSGFGAHLMIGADYRYRPSASWGLRYRRTFFDASFGAEIPGKVDMGAGVWTLSFQRIF